MPLRRRLVVCTAVGALALTALAADTSASHLSPLASPLAADGEHTAEDVVITSLASDAIEIHGTLFRPAGASAQHPVPIVLHSHGWSGSRTTAVSAFQDFLDAGFGVLSIDQRGHGDSGGLANVEDPDLEGFDQLAVNDFVATLDWVASDEGSHRSGPPRGEAKGHERGAPHGQARGHDRHDQAATDRTRDPQMAAIGGSYGGAYQLLNALMDVKVNGDSRLDAIAPQITWFDLNRSLAPSDVARSTWLTALYAAGAGMVPKYIHEGFAYGFTTGQYPDGTVPGTHDLKGEFAQHGPVWFAEQGVQLGIPALIGQGLNDNLFNFNEAWDNYTRTLTDDARSRSLLIGYNGGHALPNVLPLGDPSAGLTGPDACSPDSFRALSIRFFQEVFAGRNPQELLPAPINLSTAAGRCIHLADLGQTESVALGPLSTAATTTGGGAPIHVPLVSGPTTVAGIATVEATLTTIGADARAFFALAKGRTPADAQVIQNNVVPIRRLLPVFRQELSFDLSGVAADLADGETLYLTISAVSDMFPVHGSRNPGVLVLEDAVVHLPLLPAP